MADRITSIYEKACAKGILDPQTQSEQWFRDQLSTEQGIKSFYEHATANGMKFHPYPEFKERLSQSMNPSVKENPAPTTEEENQESLRRQDAASGATSDPNQPFVAPQDDNQAYQEQMLRTSEAMRRNAERMAQRTQQAATSIPQPSLSLGPQDGSIGAALERMQRQRLPEIRKHTIANNMLNETAQSLGELQRADREKWMAQGEGMTPTQRSYLTQAYTEDPYLAAANSVLYNAEVRMQDAKRQNGISWKNIGEGLASFGKDTGRHLLTKLEGMASFGMSDFRNAKYQRDVLKKVADANAFDNPDAVLTPQEKALYDATVTNIAVEIARQNDTSRWSKAGQITADMIPFIEDIMLGNALFKGFGDAGRKAITKGVEKHVKNKLAKWLLTNVWDVAISAGESAATAAILPHTYANMYGNMTQADMDKVGMDGYRMTLGGVKEQGAAQAWGNAYRDQVKELFTETGGNFRLIGRALIDNPLGKKILKTPFGMVLKRFEGAQGGAGSRFASMTMYHGVLGEWLEELEAAIYDGNLKEFFTADTQLPMLLSFSVPAAFTGGLNAGQHAYLDAKYKSAGKTIDKLIDASAHVGPDKNTLKGQIMATLYQTPTENLPQAIGMCVEQVYPQEYKALMEGAPEKGNKAAELAYALKEYLASGTVLTAFDPDMLGGQIADVQAHREQMRQQATEAAQAEVQSISHEDGNIYRVGIKGKDGAEGYAFRGDLDVVPNQDGTLSTRGRDLITIKMTDGTVEQVPADEVTLLDAPQSAQERIDQMTEHYFAQYANEDLFHVGDNVYLKQNGQQSEESSTIVGINDEGIEVEIIDPNGQPNTTVIPHEQAAEALAVAETPVQYEKYDTSDINYEIYPTSDEQETANALIEQYGSLANLQREMQIGYNRARVLWNNYVDSRQQHAAPQDNIVTYVLPDNTQLRMRKIRDGVYERVNEDGMPSLLFTEDDLAEMGAQPLVQEEVPANTGDQGMQTPVVAQPAYPTDEEGNPAWNQIEVPQAAQILYDTFKQNNTAAISYADDQLKEAEKVQRQAAKQKSHSLNIAQRIAEDEQNAQFKAQADAAVKYWQQVKLSLNQIKTAEEQAAQAAQQQLLQQAREQRSKTEEGTVTAPTMAERYAAADKIEGNTGTMTLPDGRELSGRYMLMAPQGVTPSHDVTKNFQRSEGYPVTSNGQSINDRDYTSDQEEQQKVQSIAQNFNGNAIKNMPVISDEGLVYNGNGRMMAGQLAALNGTDAAYTQSLMNNAAQYGFTPEQVASIPHARVVFQLDERLPYSTQSLAIFNEQETQTQSNTGKAAGYARKLTPQAVSEVLAAVDGFNTIDAFFSDKKAPFNLINSLINAGIIAQREKAEMVDGDKLSATGRERLSNILFGTVFDNETIRLMGDDAALKNSIMRALPQILDNKSLGEFSLESDINDAIRLLYEVRRAGVPFQSFVRQTVMSEDGEVHTAAENYSPYQLLLAEEMTDGGVDAFRDVLNLYNEQAKTIQGGQVDIFGNLPTPTELKNLILQRYGKEPTETERPSAGRQTDNAPASAPASNEQEVIEPEKPLNGKLEYRLQTIADEQGKEYADQIRNFVNARRAEGAESVTFAVDRYFNVIGVYPSRMEAFKNKAAYDVETFKIEKEEPNIYEQLAQAEAETDTNPTEAQKKAENYKQGHVTLWGLPITIENPKGSIRRGTDANGKQWEQEMHHTYGKIRRTEGVDGDHIDVFIGPNLTSDKVFVVDQRNVDTGEFDEHKCMLGFDSLEDAQNGYLSNYEEGWQGMGTVTEVTMDEFKKWVDSSHRKTKPFAEYKSVKPEGAASVGYEEPAQEQEIPEASNETLRKRLAKLVDGWQLGNREPSDGEMQELRDECEKIVKRYKAPTIKAALDAIEESVAKQKAEGAAWIFTDDEETALYQVVKAIIGKSSNKVTKNVEKQTKNEEKVQQNLQESEKSSTFAGVNNNQNGSNEENSNGGVSETGERESGEDRLQPSELGRGDRASQEDLQALKELLNGKDPDEQQKIARQWAEEHGVLFDLFQLINEKGLTDFPGGNENSNWIDKQAGVIYKMNNLMNSKNRISVLLERVALYNQLFHDTRLEFVGLATVAGGRQVYPVFSQPYVADARNASKEEIDENMHAMGYEPTGKTDGEYSNGKYIIGDARPRNVLVRTDGNVFYVDVDVTLAPQNEPAPTKPTRKQEQTTSQSGANNSEVVSKQQPARQKAEPKNTIFTDEAYEAAKARMKARLNRLNMGVDPEAMIDEITIAGYHIERGVRKFADFARELIKEFGDGIRERLKPMYNYFRDIPEGRPYRDEMDHYDTVMAFDLDTITAEEEQPAAVEEEPEHKYDAGDKVIYKGHNCIVTEVQNDGTYIIEYPNALGINVKAIGIAESDLEPAEYDRQKVNRIKEQYNKIKEQYPDATLLFRVGDFYELYKTDAEEASKILAITLTHSNIMGENTPMAGFPFHALDKYLPMLVRAGKRVAICDQLEDPKKAKGLVKRGVTELVTPGVPYQEEAKEEKKDDRLFGTQTTATHTKTGAEIIVVKPYQRVENFAEINALARKHHGRYNTKPYHAFVFDTEEDAEAFNLEAGKLLPATDTTVEETPKAAKPEPKKEQPSQEPYMNHVYNMDDWHAAGDLRPAEGQEVVAEIIETLRGDGMPTTDNSKYFQAQEPYSHDRNGKPLYKTFEKIDGKWFYRGIMPDVHDQVNQPKQEEIKPEETALEHVQKTDMNKAVQTQLDLFADMEPEFAPQTTEETQPTEEEQERTEFTEDDVHAGLRVRLRNGEVKDIAAVSRSTEIIPGVGNTKAQLGYIYFTDGTECKFEDIEAIHVKDALTPKKKVEEKVAAASGDPNDPKRVFARIISSRLLDALASGDTQAPFRSILDLRKLAKEVGLQVDENGKDDIMLKELVEDGIVQAARQVIESKQYGGSKSKTAYDAIVRLYEMQPSIQSRSSNSIAMAQFSTPIPMGFVADMFAYSPDMKTVLEPTAGNGMLVFAIPAERVHANELDEKRLENLRLQGFKVVTSQDAREPLNRAVSEYDAVIANPPFGPSPAKMYDGKEISGLDPQIAINALSAMKDDGRAAIIIGGNMEYADNGSVKDHKAFWTYLYDHYNVKGVVDMDGELYRRQGTTYDVRMILIDGRRSEAERAQTKVIPPVQSKAVAKVKTFDELYDTVLDLLHSNNKTNGNEVLRTQSAPLSDNSQSSGQPVKEGHRGESNADVANGQRSGRENGSQGTQQPSKGGVSQTPATGASNTARPTDAGVSQPKADTGVNAPAAVSDRPSVGDNGRVQSEPVQSVRTPADGVGLTPKPQEKRNLTAEKLSYRPHSQAFSLQSVAPAAMVEAMDKVLAEIEHRTGKSIDQFVADELGYDSVQDAHNALAAEQMDSVAMAIYQMYNGMSLIIGDQTGVGKGRQMAALIRWAVQRGKKPIFITQKADLFSDIYRDLVDIGSGDLRPFIFNSDGAMVNSQGETVHKPLSAAEQRKVFESGVLPDEYDFAVLTYSQVNTGDEISRQTKNKDGYKIASKKTQGRPSPKADFLRQIANDNYLFLDESHTAAGDSNIGAYIRSIIGTKVNASAGHGAKGVTFASATFAKRPDTMPMYALRTAMSAANVEQDKLIEIIEKGGVTLQEIMSRALTESGQMVRRERDMSDVQTDWKTIEDPEIVRKAREQYDRTITAFNAIIDFQTRYITPLINEKDLELAAMMETVSHKKGTKSMGIDNTPFASKTYNYTKQLMLALKVDAIVAEVEKEIKALRHPVIALESTMEASIKDYAPGDIIEEPTFSASLLRGLDSCMQYTITDEEGKEVHGMYSPAELGPEGEAAYYRLQEFIRESTKDIFISPLDAIIEGLKAKGYRVGELTGRNTYVERDSNGKVVVRRRTDKDKKRMQRDFNGGALDVLILNKSASTGISLHASKTFADQRQRSMIIAQPLSDINDYMQMIGRIDRTGQVHRGYYINLGLPVPAESRFLMMLSTKLKSLNANTTTSQDSESNEVDAPDLLNKYGSQVVIEYLRDNPTIYEKIGEPLKGGNGTIHAEDLEEYKPSEDDALKITGRVALLSTKEQEEFYQEVVRRYNDLIRYLNDTGMNDLKITTMPLRAKTLARKVSSEGKDPNGTNPFAGNAYVEKVEMDVLRKPMKADEVRKLMEQLNGNDSKARIDAIWTTINTETKEKADAENERYAKAMERVEKEVESFAAKVNANEKLSAEDKQRLIEGKRAELAKAQEDKHNANNAKIQSMLSYMRKALFDMFSVGHTYLVPDDLEAVAFNTSAPAIFCGFKAKDSKITPSTTFAVFATLDGRRKIEIKLTELPILNRIHDHTMMNYDAARQTTLDNWDTQIPTQTRKEGYIMTGNILQAVSDSQDQMGNYPGQLVSYTDIDGNVHDGILMPDKWEPGQLRNAGAPIAARFEQMKHGTVTSADGKVTIRRGWGAPDFYYLDVPKSRKEGGQYYLNKDILPLVEGGEFYTSHGQMEARVPAENMPRVLDILSNLGVKAQPDANERTEFSITNLDYPQFANQTEAQQLATAALVEVLNDNTDLDVFLATDEQMPEDGSEKDVRNNKYSQVATDAWNKYQYDGELESIRDVAEYIEENMPKDETTTPLFDAIDKYRVEEEEDRMLYGERGDLEPFEDTILAEIEKLMQPTREAMLTPSGTLYGWAIGDRIYLTKDGLNPNSPIHEYSHIWAKAMMRNNREGWQSIVDIFKGTPFWDEVVNDPNYKGLTTDDAICSEVLARYSGTRGAARMEEWAKEEQYEAEQSGSLLRGAKVRQLINRAKKALADFWHWVGVNLFGIKHFDSAEQVADRVLWDMLNGTELDVTADREMQHIKDRAIADGTFMKAPNGQPTNLNERQWLQVRTRAFKRWFGDWENDPQNASKVVDANGEPMVVYHGTAKDFTVFGEGKKGWRTSKLRTFYFTPDYRMAMIHSGYSRPGDNGIRRHKIMPSFLNARNIKVVENAVIEDVGYWATDSQLDEFELTYDGLLSQDGKQYVMLHPNQIKSATNNNGDFSEENDDIEMMISGYTQEKQRTINEWYAAHPRPQYQVGEKLEHYQARLEQWNKEYKQFRASMEGAKSAPIGESTPTPRGKDTQTPTGNGIQPQGAAPAFVPGVRPTPMANETPYEYALRLRQYYQLMRDERLVAEYVAEINNQADAAAKVLKKNTIVRGLLDAAKPIENFQEWMKQRGATITDESNAYTDTFLATGRVTEANEQMQRDIIRPLAKQIAKIIAPDAKTGKSRLDGINIVWHNMDVAGTGCKLDGKALTPREIIGVYCQAKDCAEAIEKGLPDRGAKGFLNNLGMSHDDIIAAVESVIPRAELDELWRLINAATHFALNYDYESGRISEDTHTEFYQREFYVPQRGWRERDESGLITEYEPVGKRGNDPYNAALVKAHGRQSMASDPFAYIMSIDASSIVSSENNKIKQKFLQFCLDNEDLGLQTGAFRVKKYWIMNVIDPETGKIKLDEEGNPMMEVSYVAPSAEDLSHDRTIKELIKKKRKEWAKVNQAYLERQSHGELGPQLEAAYKTKLSKIEQAIEDLEQQMHIAWNATNTNITQRTSDEKKQHEVRVLLDGQEYLIEVQDEKLANAINKKFKQHQEQLFNTSQKMRNATRFMSAVLTQYNPEFAASNFARDFQVALATLTAEHPELVGSFLKNFAACQPAVWQYAFNDKVRDRAVFRDSELGRYLQEYFKAGAATGFSYMQDLKSLRQDFDAMVIESNLRRGIKGAVGTLSMLTQVSETAVRFAGYVSARQKGMGINEAAYLSKELTTNFDRAGEVADSGWMSWFSFFRATLNGNIKFLKALKKMPVAYSIIAAAYVAMGMLNQFLNPDDPEDEVWAGDYTRESNFVIGKWRIPTAHFLRMFFAAGVNAAKWMQGEKSFGEATYNTANFASQELLPNYLNLLGNGTEWNSREGKVDFTWEGLLQGVMPSPVSPIADVYFNRDFRGATINREPFAKSQEGTKDILLSKENTLPVYKWLTQAIYEGVGGNMNAKYQSDDPAWRSWLFDTSASSVEHVVEGYMPAGMDMFITLGEAIYDAATGTPTGPDKWPFVRKFYNAYTPERAYMQQYYLLNGRVKEFKRNMDDYRKNDRTKYNILTHSQEYRNYQEAERLVKKQKENPTTADVQALINANKQWIK